MTITELHKEVFDFLMEKRKTMPDLYFTLNTNTEELEKGYILPTVKGSDLIKVAFSFWLSTSFEHFFLFLFIKNEKLYLLVNINIGHLSKEIVGTIGNFGIEANDYVKNYGNWRSGLDYFINHHKLTIDELVIKYPTYYEIKPIEEQLFQSRLLMLKEQNYEGTTLNPDLKLQSLFLKNIGHFEELSLDFKRVTILIGENGSGKSTVLRSIALALTGTDCFDLDKDFKKASTQLLKGYLKINSYQKSVPQYAENGIISLLTNEEQTIGLKLKPSELVIEKVETDELNENRNHILFEQKYLRTLVMGFAQTEEKMDSSLVVKNGTKPMVTDLFPIISNKGQNILADLVEWIYYYVHEVHNPEPIHALFDIFTKIIGQEISLKTPYKTEGAVGSPKGEKSIIVCTPENPDGVHLDLISQGYKNIFRWVGGMVMRTYEYNKVFIPKQPFQNISGIALIDEIDTYLHPKWQRNILKVLLDEFPNIQFVVTTHSPVILSYLLTKDIAETQVYFINPEISHPEPITNFIGRKVSENLYDYQDVEDRPVEITEKITELLYLAKSPKNGKFDELFSELSTLLGEDSGVIKQVKKILANQ